MCNQIYVMLYAQYTYSDLFMSNLTDYSYSNDAAEKENFKIILIYNLE